MPTYSNIHAQLDNSELHHPKDFSLADNDSFVGKNLLGELEWFSTFWQQPVLDIVEASEAPPTALDGDRYILDSIASTAICDSIDATIDGTIDTNVCIHEAWGSNVALGDIVEYFTLDENGSVVNQWRSVAAQEGYQVFNRADDTNYYFDGTNWKPLHAEANNGSGAFWRAVTRSELIALQDNSMLEPGVQYYLLDKDIVLKATSSASFAPTSLHTRNLASHAYVDLLSWTAGSVNSIMVGSTELLPAPVDFVDDILTSLEALVAAINGFGSGYQSIAAGYRLIILAPADLGSVPNGSTFSIDVDGTAIVSEPFAYGVDIGEYWFTATYSIVEDTFYALRDTQGNEVVVVPELSAVLDYDPFEYFPWGYETIRNNKLHNSLLLAYTVTGNICNNELTEHAILKAHGYSGDGCNNNQLNSGASADVILCTNKINDNRLSTGSQLIFSGTDTAVYNNDLHIAAVIAFLAQTRSFNSNNLQNTQLMLLGHSSDGSSTVDFTDNVFIDCGYVDMTNACTIFRRNKFMAASISAVGMNANCFLNTMEAGSLTLDGFDGTDFVQNDLKQESEVDLTNASCTFNKNKLSASGISATGATGSIESNVVEQGSTLTFDNYSGNAIAGNQISNSTITAENCTAQIDQNQVNYSTVTLTNYIGGYFSGNSLYTSSLNGSGATNSMYNNKLVKSELTAENATGEISDNVATNDSTINADNFHGLRCNYNRLIESSELILDGCYGDIGRIILNDVTTLDISDNLGNVYVVDIKLPHNTVVIPSGVSYLKMDNEVSNYDRPFSVSSNTIDFLESGNMFAGILDINITTTIDTVSNLNLAPKYFKLKASGLVNVTIDSSSATNIILPLSYTSISISGNEKDYILFENIGSSVLVKEFNNY